MRILAPAKINLHLRVGPVAADGFHPLLTWMCTVGLHDVLNVEATDGPEVVLTCDTPALTCDPRNLVVRAASAMADALAAERGRRGNVLSHRAGQRPGAAIHLEKRIPIGAGLGGGSSDAAATLSALNRAWGAGWPVERLSELAGRIGSDVPFFLHGPSSVCTRRGEVVRPVAPPAARWAVLVLPELAMATAEVYRRFDEMGGGDTTPPKDRREAFAPVIADEPDWGAWSRLQAAQLLPRLVNDLEAAAFSLQPGLGKLRDDLERMSGRPVRMSGSGSSLFTLFDAESEASKAAAAITSDRNVAAVAAELGWTAG